MFNLSDEEIRAVKALFALSGISALAAVCRIILSGEEKERTLSGFMSRYTLGMFSGLMTGLAIHDKGLSIYFEFAVVIAAAFTAKEILLFLISLAQTVKDNPKQIMDYFLDFIFRRPTGTSSLKEGISSENRSKRDKFD